MPCNHSLVDIELNQPFYTPGDLVTLNIKSQTNNNNTYGTIKVIDMSVYLEVDQKKKGEISRVS